MLLRKAQFIPVAILGIAILGFGLWLWKAPTRLFSDPVAIRNTTYLRAHAPGTNTPTPPTNLLSSIGVQRSDAQITIAIPDWSRLPSDGIYGPVTDHHADASQTIQLGEGSIRMAYLASGWAVPETNFDYSIQIPANFYSADLKPLPTNQIPRHERTLQFDGDYPAAVFYFNHSNLPALKQLRFSAFDARTHSGLNSGYGTSSLSNSFNFSSTVQIWHQTPIELLLTVATGPVETYALPPREGSQLDHPGGFIRLLIVADQDLNGWTSQGDGRTNTISFPLRRRLPSDGPRASLVFYSWPTAFNTPLEFECLDANGKPLPSRGGGSSDRVIVASIAGRADDIKEIRVKRYPNTHRLLFVLPELPGLPEENRGLKNLFDVHVPYMRFQYEHQFQENIGRLVQMDMRFVPLTFPNNYFPTVRTNTTPRALFGEMERMVSDKQMRLVADPAENVIKPASNPFAIIIQNIAKKVGL